MASLAPRSLWTDMIRSREQPSYPTIGDVAVAAGVSPATAARALGGYGRVSAAVRARVLAEAERVGYRPNSLARSMITGTTHTIGVVIADIENPFFARAVRGIADTAHAAGYEVILTNSDERLETERAAVGVLYQKRVDGLIVAPASNTDVAHLAELVERRVPVVFLDRGVPSIKADAVVVDSQRAAQGAVSHLIRLGHRRIAIVAESDTALSAEELKGARFGPADVFPSLQRLIGWAAAYSAAGLPVLDEMILRCDYDRTAVAGETAAALRRGDPPTAIFTTDGIMTLGAVDGIVDAGRAIPDDVSIVAFDDLDWTTLVRPQLTVVAQPVYELGAAATTRLLDRLAGDDGPPRTVVLDTSFIVRGSTGRPAQAILGRAV